MYKKIKSKIIPSLLVVGLLFASNSCDTTELEILENPNALTPESSDVDLFLNAIQINFSTFFEQITEEGMEVTRILHMFGPIYDNAYGPGQLNGPYATAYSSMLADMRAMEPVAAESGFFTHIGISNVIEAYTIATLVDYLGDIPYSEAAQGTDFINPNLDPGEEVYAAAFALLDKALAEFAKDETLLPNDLYYGDGSGRAQEDKWIKLANTLKLKLLLQTRLVDGSVAGQINSIISSGNYIQSEADDFKFQYSTIDANPDSRHPIFSRNFDVAADVADYMSNSFMYYMNGMDKENIDPRIRYYFYRQSLNFTDDPNEASCIVEDAPSHYDLSLYPFCYPGEGYWGRDHGDNDGIPPDGGLRTTWGIYPVGGQFDDESGEAVPGRTIGLQGAGISPIMMSSYVDFMLAEAALTLGTTGEAKDYLESGVRKSISTVLNFGERSNLDDVVIADDPDTEENEQRTVRDLYVPTDDDVDAYVAEVLANYDGEGDDDGKLNTIVKEYFLALFGNGIEAYNTYRRTGKPENLQPTKISPSGTYQNSFLYPSNMVDNNSNISQKADQSVRVFWAEGGPTVN